MEPFENYDKIMKVQYEALDKIDFIPFLKLLDGKSFDELFPALEIFYNNTEISNNDVLQGCIVNHMSDSKMKKYLEKRYGDKISFFERSEYEIHYNG